MTRTGTTRKSEDQAPSTSQVLEAAIKAQLNQAERIRQGGAHDLVASLPSEHQRTVMGVIDQS